MSPRTPRAFVTVRKTPPYRAEMFERGLTALGFQIEGRPPHLNEARRGDAIVVWNKSARTHACVREALVSGASLIVAENGYVGQDDDGIQTYALALDGHCGSGRWYVGDDARLRVLERRGDRVQRWRSAGDYVLVADQRGIGSPLMRSPWCFADDRASEILGLGIPVRVRRHPGRHAGVRPLDVDLASARAVVVWSSNVATRALLRGVPTMYCAPHIVTAGGAKPYAAPLLRDPSVLCDTEGRIAALTRMSWAQWFVAEVASGEALRVLLDVHEGRLPSCQAGAGL